MPLGDSITLGINDVVTQTHGGWRGEFFDKRPDLKPVGSVTAPDALLFPWNFNEGHSGFTSQDILTNINTWYTANPAFAVLGMIGTNDISASVPAATTINNIKAIISAILAINSSAFVLWSTVLNQVTGNVSQNAAVVAINTLLPAAIASFSNPKVVMITMPNLADVYLGFAGEHPTMDGYQAFLAPTWLAAVTAAGF